ncbi:PREDICTED: uncharacterized protein LOC104611169 [Nelumbo nucifera]|uniref:Uncharacterized protein LOC104611169 n=1 Tax=Nelumbo nucifera TaxID=4432 RepID=A0A1U8BIB2_NELNU|nr:PREDICTED: uncharacterized protein LOC104611169 [Nelumbo nucifera]
MVVALGPGKFYGSSLPRPWIYTNVKLSDEGRVDPPLPVLEPLLSWANDAHWSMGGLSFKRCRLQGRIEGSVKKLRAQQEKQLKNKLKAKETEKNLKKSNIDVSTSPNADPSPSPFTRRGDFLVDEDDLVEEERPTVRFRRLRKKVVHENAKEKVSPVRSSARRSAASPASPPPAPSRRVDGINADDSEEEEVEETPVARLRRAARKLGDDFDKVVGGPALKKVETDGGKRKDASANGSIIAGRSRGSPLKKNKRTREGEKIINSSSPSPISPMDAIASRTRSRRS